MAFTKTYEDLCKDVVADRLLKLWIGETEVGATYDPITHIVVWQADYAVRDEAYIRALIDKAQ